MNDKIDENKRSKNKLIPYSNKQAFYASVFISVLLNLLIFLGLLYGRVHEIFIFWKDYTSFFCWHLGGNILLFYLLFRFNFHTFKKRRTTGRQGLYVLGGTILICFAISPVLSKLQWHFLGSEMQFGIFAMLNLFKDLIVGIIVIMMSTMIYLHLKREQTILANQKLIQENIQVKYESLKNQLNPHFLFNSLNTLNGLVGIDDDKAHEYIDNLSSVFRYTLHSKSVCTLEKEMEFVNDYFALMKIRYGESLQLCDRINPVSKSYFVIPVSIQLLVENAVKHNVVSNNQPLTIIIESSEDSVTVCNRINPKVTISTGGVGLANLMERYSMLFGKTIEIKETNHKFCVTIPLIKEIAL